MADGMPAWHQSVAKANCKLKLLNSLTRQKVSIMELSLFLFTKVVDRMNLYLVMDEE